MTPPLDPSTLLRIVELGSGTSKRPWHHMEAQDEVWDGDGNTLVEFSSPCTEGDKAFIAASANAAVPMAEELIELRERYDTLRLDVRATVETDNANLAHIVRGQDAEIAKLRAENEAIRAGFTAYEESPHVICDERIDAAREALRAQ